MMMMMMMIIIIIIIIIIFFIILILLSVSFSHQYQQGVFHWNSSDSKFPHLSRILLSILTDLSCTVLFPKSLEIDPRALNRISITVTFMFQTLALWQVSGIYLIFEFPLFLLWNLLEWQSQQFDIFISSCWL